MFGQCHEYRYLAALTSCRQFTALIIVVVCTYSQQDNAMLVLLMKLCRARASINHNVADKAVISTCLQDCLNWSTFYVH